MSEPSSPTYFAVVRLNGVETPCLYYDYLPAGLANDPQLVYLLRLDTLPLASRWTSLDNRELMAAFQRLRAANRLPPRWSPPPRPKGDAAKVLHGHHESTPREVIQRTRQVHPDD